MEENLGLEALLTKTEKERDAALLRVKTLEEALKMLLDLVKKDEQILLRWSREDLRRDITILLMWVALIITNVAYFLK